MANFFDLVEQGKPILITNHGAGVVLLELERPGKNKKPYTVKIPQITKYPIPFHKIIPRPILEHDSDAIYEWIKKGVFKLWEPKIAKKKFGTDVDMENAIVEVVNKTNQQHRFEAPKAKGKPFKTAAGAMDLAKTVTGKETTADLGLTDEIEDDDDDTGPMGIKTTEDGAALSLSSETTRIPPKIKQMIASLREDKSLAKEILRDFKLMDDDIMTDDALGLVIRKTKKFKPIQKWAKQEMARRTNDAVVEEEDEEVLLENDE